MAESLARVLPQATLRLSWSEPLETLPAASPFSAANILPLAQIASRLEPRSDGGGVPATRCDTASLQIRPHLEHAGGFRWSVGSSRNYSTFPIYWVMLTQSREHGNHWEFSLQTRYLTCHCWACIFRLLLPMRSPCYLVSL